MLTKEQADTMIQFGIDLGPTIYGSLMAGAAPLDLIQACGPDIAGPVIAKWQAEEQAKADALAKARSSGSTHTRVVHPPEKEASNAIIVCMFKAAKLAYNGKPYDLIATIDTILRMHFAADHVPADLITLLTSVQDSKGKIKGSVSTRTGDKYGGKAVNVSVRFDALQASRASKKIKQAEQPTRLIGPQDLRTMETTVQVEQEVTSVDRRVRRGSAEE